MIRTRRHNQLFTPQRGFTLVEMSVVLIIVGLIIMTIFPALTALRMGQQRSVTDSNLQALMRATAVYVQANGCLPCPTPFVVSPEALGRVRGDLSTAVCGNCPPALAEGIPPFVSLGIPPTIAKDGWGHWIRMRVDPALTVSAFAAVVPPTLPCTETDAQPCATGKSQKGLCKAGLSSTNRISLKTTETFNNAETLLPKAAVLFISHGANGYGAPTPNATALSFPQDLALCTVKTPEACNADGNSVFVAPSPLANPTSFDDSLIYADRNNLVSWLGNHSCETPW